MHAANRIRYVVSEAREPGRLLAELGIELRFLADADPRTCETTLLIHPWVLNHFLEFNDFLDRADAALAEAGLEGVLQLASFHPEYRFAGTAAEDVTNCTNRSPWPMLHLLREESVEAALASRPQGPPIYETNIETMRRLGHDGWRAILRGPAPGEG